MAQHSVSMGVLTPTPALALCRPSPSPSAPPMWQLACFARIMPMPTSTLPAALICTRQLLTGRTQHICLDDSILLFNTTGNKWLNIMCQVFSLKYHYWMKFRKYCNYYFASWYCRKYEWHHSYRACVITYTISESKIRFQIKLYLNFFILSFSIVFIYTFI